MEHVEIILIFIGSLALAVIGFGWSMECPSCKKWFAERDLNKEIIDEKIGYEVHNREIVTKDGEGNVISTRIEPEQRRVKTTWYYQNHICSFCDKQ